MSIWTAGLVGQDAGTACALDRLRRAASEQPLPVRRVRQEVRDAVAVACFSAGASVAVALTLLLLVSLVGQHA